MYFLSLSPPIHDCFQSNPIFPSEYHKKQNKYLTFRLMYLSKCIASHHCLKLHKFSKCIFKIYNIFNPLLIIFALQIYEALRLMLTSTCSHDQWKFTYMSHNLKLLKCHYCCRSSWNNIFKNEKKELWFQKTATWFITVCCSPEVTIFPQTCSKRKNDPSVQKLQFP